MFKMSTTKEMKTSHNATFLSRVCVSVCFAANTTFPLRAAEREKILGHKILLDRNMCCETSVDILENASTDLNLNQFLLLGQQLFQLRRAHSPDLIWPGHCREVNLDSECFMFQCVFQKTFMKLLSLITISFQ